MNITQIEALLNEHRFIYNMESRPVCKGCAWAGDGTGRDDDGQHRAHLADVIHSHLALGAR